jgi:hypothetical protein
MAYYSTPSYGNITLVNTNPYSSSSVLVTGGTSYGAGGYTLATSATNATWTQMANGTNPSLQVQGDAEFKGNVTINGQNLAETLRGIQDRLAILVPDPKLLDKYEALKQAYDHYKLLEALCVEQSNTDK